MSISSDEIISDAREGLLSYCVMMNHSYAVPKHLQTIARALEAVDRGVIKRLIVTIPPRHGKSMLDSQYFPAWFLGRNPDKYLITATYGQDLASDFGRKVRDQIKDPLFNAIFPQCKMKEDTTAAHRFKTEAGGEFYAVGVGGPITGRGAHLLLIDDPIKNREEADSKLVREKNNEWYDSTAYTRLMPGGAVVIIMTRWHENDLVGHVLKNHAHEGWTVINLPAIDDFNQPLWPDAYPLDVLKSIKSTLSEYDWACLYQQNPIPKEGNLFKAEWLLSGLSDEYAAKFMAIDPAISKKESADKTAFSVWYVGYGQVPILTEIETIFGRFDFHEQIVMGKALHEKHKLDMFGVENVAFQKALGDEFFRMGLPCIQLKADGDKFRRAMSVSHFFAQGRVRINTPALRDQLLRFRGIDGDEDDLVDAAVHCIRLIRDYSHGGFEKGVDRYKDLDPRSKVFWRDHFGELPTRSEQDQIMVNLG